MIEYCNSHISMSKDVAEVKTDVKWIKNEMIKTNGAMFKHIGESELFRTKVIYNTAFRLLFMWFIGSGTVGVVIWGVVNLVK